MKYNELKKSALEFIEKSCKELRYSKEKSDYEKSENKLLGTSINENQIPYNMQMENDKRCFEVALSRFLDSGRKEDAFDVYFCYLEMFVGNYSATRQIIEMLSEYENNGSRLLMKHRDHYSHSVYVFALGLMIYRSNKPFRDIYSQYYGTCGSEAACHFLEFWGLASLFHDIGYPFELPFEQVCAYFESEKNTRRDIPFMAYNALDSFLKINPENAKSVYPNCEFHNLNELFSHALYDKVGAVYGKSEGNLLDTLNQKPTAPDKFNYFMDHAYFSAVILYKKLFDSGMVKFTSSHLDALTAILMHNSLYKFGITNYKGDKNIPFKAELHPLAFMLMLCDELQCWDRTAYGRESRLQLHPMAADFEVNDSLLKAVYIYDEDENDKMTEFENRFRLWKEKQVGKECPKCKAYSGMVIKDDSGKSEFQSDIEKIVDLSGIRFEVCTEKRKAYHNGANSYLSEVSFLNLYNFAVVLNGRWNDENEKIARAEMYLSDKSAIKDFNNQFDKISLEYKLLNIGQAKAFAKYLDVIGCFYTDKQVDFEEVRKFTPEQLEIIGPLEHKRWLQEHYDMGWTYGEPKDKSERENKRIHTDMIPGVTVPEYGIVTAEMAKKNYDRLSKAEQDKDTKPMNRMLTMIKLYDGLRIYKLK